MTESTCLDKTGRRSKAAGAKRRSVTFAAGAVALTIAALTALMWYGIPACVVAWTSPYIYSQAADVPTTPVAVVLGAAVNPNGSLSPVLQGRVDAAITLYKAGKVSKLLLSGDNRTPYYDEPTAMKRYAVAHGVRPVDAIRDYAGLRTFDTCYRARHVFGLTRAVFVTQEFHLSRTLYTARSLGIDAVGFVAPNNMPDSDVAYFKARERAATIKALLDLVFDHKPKFSGPVERPIISNTDPNR
jgi:SanA protein